MEEFDVAVVGLGALGSAAAYHLARAGVRTVAFEQFELGHVRGASHDTSRIVRTSYGSPEYVRFAQAAYREWASLEADTGERLLTVTGGVVLIPDDGPYDAADFARSLAENGVPFELLAPDEVRSRWPQFAVPPGVTTVYTPDSGIAHAARTVATLQMHARMRGAVLRDRTRVDALVPVDGGVVVATSAGEVRARRVIVAADAWTNTLLEPLGIHIPLEVMQEQVSYFAPSAPEDYAPERFPVWIWEDEQNFYGFPTYGEPTIKAARDVSENHMTPAERTFVPSAERVAELSEFLSARIPGSGELLRTVTCQYALTPGRRFVLGALREQPDIIVGLGAGHAFKFTPAFGLGLAELAIGDGTTDDLSAFAVDATVAPAL